MTGAQIKALADALVQDTMPDAFFIGAVNASKDALEGERAWEHLKKLNSSTTASSGTDTSSKTLPTDLIEPLRLTVGTADEELSLVSQGDSRILRSESGFWYIDWANGLFYLTGATGGGTIYLLYKRSTDDIASGTSPAWPTALANTVGRYFAYDVAKQWFYQDQGEKEFSWSPEMASEARRLKEQLITWDEKLKARHAAVTPVHQMEL